MTPLISLFVTVAGYSFALLLQKRFNVGNYIPPTTIAMAFVIVYLQAFDVAYVEYIKDVDFINTLLGTATVALAIPLYHQVANIRRSTRAILLTIVAGCLIAALSAFVFATLMGATDDIRYSIITKSVTLPIAIGIAEKVQIEPSLAVLFVFGTGVIGSIIAPFIFKLFKITDEKSIGLSLGLTCHGLGLIKAFQYGQTAVVFSAIGMSLMGVISGIVLPMLILHVLSHF